MKAAAEVLEIPSGVQKVEGMLYVVWRVGCGVNAPTIEVLVVSAID